jgi:hypothetical protein
MARRKSKSDPLDKEIEQLYYKHASGRNINVMKIGQLYTDAKADHANGKTLEQAVIDAIAKHCEPA